MWLQVKSLCILVYERPDFRWKWGSMKGRAEKSRCFNERHQRKEQKQRKEATKPAIIMCRCWRLWFLWLPSSRRKTPLDFERNSSGLTFFSPSWSWISAGISGCLWWQCHHYFVFFLKWFRLFYIRKNTLSVNSAECTLVMSGWWGVYVCRLPLQPFGHSFLHIGPQTWWIYWSGHEC